MTSVTQQRAPGGKAFLPFLPLLMGIVAAALIIGFSQKSSSSSPTGSKWQDELAKMPTGLVNETLPILQKVQGPHPTAADIQAAFDQADKVQAAGFVAIAQVLRQYAELRQKGQ
jgi:hypothetical protein